MNEDMERAMQFIVEQQARSAASMQRSDERRVEFENRHAEAQANTRIESVMLRLANVQLAADGRMSKF